jgi:hypothetical protein
MLFILGFLFIFTVDGLTGVMVAAVPYDWQVHDTYFVVGHFHYILIGGMVFPLFAAFYYWPVTEPDAQPPGSLGPSAISARPRRASKPKAGSGCCWCRASSPCRAGPSSRKGRTCLAQR